MGSRMARPPLEVEWESIAQTSPFAWVLTFLLMYRLHEELDLTYFALVLTFRKRNEHLSILHALRRDKTLCLQAARQTDRQTDRRTRG